MKKWLDEEDLSLSPGSPRHKVFTQFIQESSHKLNKIKLVVFDMDGTLFDSEPLHHVALVKTVKNALPHISIPAADYIGVSDSDVYKDLIQKHPLFSLSLTSFLQHKTQNLLQLIEEFKDNNLRQLIHDDGENLLRLLQQQNIGIALVSASEQEIVDYLLQASGLSAFFKIQIGRQKTHFSKPNPSPYLLVMRHFQATPQETIIFEDSPTGLMAARLSGGQTIPIY